MTPDEIIRRLDLLPHPEGGFYRETYRSSGTLPGLQPPHAFSTAIYYMLVPGSVSKFHRLNSDEVFHFYMGDPVTWVLLKPRKIERVVLGNDLKTGHQLQTVIPAGTWFGGFLNEGGKYALMGTTVAPGFEFADFQLGERQALVKEFPFAMEDIHRLT